MAEYIDKTAIRQALYDADAISFKGLEILNQFPAADVVERKYGHWKRASKNLVSCSCCHNCIVDDRALGEFYCHNCGANMQEQEDIPMEYFESGGK